MRTRVIKALSNGKEPRIVNKVVVYDDNGNQVDCCYLQVDEDGRKFYYPTNKNCKSGKFTDRIEDAINCIRDGYGDAVSISGFLGMHFGRVVRYLDREYGEPMRQKSLEGWKDTKFAYAVKYGRTNAFSDGYVVGDDYTLIYPCDKGHRPLTFKTEQEANQFIEMVETEALAYDNEYRDVLKSDKDEDEKEKLYDEIFTKAQKTKDGGTGNMYSVFWNVMYSIDEGMQKNEKAYYLKVIQIVYGE